MSLPPLPEPKFIVDEGLDIFASKRPLPLNTRSQRVRRLGWNILSTLVFPIGLYRLGALAIKKIATRAILPAASMFTSEEKRTLHRERGRFTNRLVDNVGATIQTADGVKLDTISIVNATQKELPPEEQKWVIYLQGNGTCMEESLDTCNQRSIDTGANFLVGNYRGVMRSQGSATASHDLVLDGEAMVQYLFSQGVKEEHILLHGWSLGGAVAAEVASHHSKMHLCSERSFSSLGNVVASYCGRGCKRLASLAKRLVTKIGWHFDGVANIEKIKGKKLVIYTKEDNIIPYKGASLRRALKKKTLLLAGEEMRISNQINPHCYPLERTPDCYSEYIKFVKNALEISDSC